MRDELETLNFVVGAAVDQLEARNALKSINRLCKRVILGGPTVQRSALVSILRIIMKAYQLSDQKGKTPRIVQMALPLIGLKKLKGRKKNGRQL